MWRWLSPVNRRAFPEQAKNHVVVAAALCVACAALRLPGLRALPVFNDEAIFLRISVLVREAPIERAFLSLQEANPPFHTWLLALAGPFSNDPVLSGRLLSVLLGLLTIAAFFALARKINRASSASRWAGSGPAAATLLLVCCPFAALAQRMARMDALFLLENALVALVAVLLVSARSRSRILALGLVLGLLMGATMLTRQNVSYVLWALPILALILLPGERQLPPTALFASLLAALVLATVLWAPMLITKLGPDLGTRIFHLQAAREAMPVAARWNLAAHHAGETLSWLATYLTPPVLLLSAAGLVWLALRRRRVFLFLVAWIGILLLPLLFFATVFFPRYALPAVLPLLYAGGEFLAVLAAWLFSRPIPRPARVVASGLLFVAALAWPALDCLRQIADWKTMPLASEDRWQLVSGWPAGAATEVAAAYLEAEARRRPAVVITSPDSGNPPDALWLLLLDKPGVALHGGPSLGEQLLPAFGEGSVLLRGDPRLNPTARPTRLQEEAAVYFVSREKVITHEGLRPAEQVWRPANPELSAVLRFENPPYPDGRPGDAVLIWRLR